jgi:hypothetical protein
MKCKALSGLRLLVGLLLFAVVGGQSGGLDLIVHQIQIFGPRQWLNLMAGSMVTGVPAITPVRERIARTLSVQFTAGETREIV